MWEVFEETGNKKYYNRSSQSAHGGKMETMNSIKIVTETKTWPLARDNCVSLGAKLFANLDGTGSQIDSLQHVLTSQGQQNERHWLGIYSNTPGIWQNTNSQVMGDDLLRWNEGEPNNFGQDFYAILLTTLYLNDATPDQIIASICDMN